jgi:hypothetical protein
MFGSLVLAAMIPDLAWRLFMILAIEHLRFTPGMGVGNDFHGTNIAISHSLMTNTIWAALLAGVYGFRNHYARGALFMTAMPSPMRMVE